jgi:hypothetical protein
MKSEKIYLSVFIKKCRAFGSGPRVENLCNMLDIMLVAKGDIVIDLDHMRKHFGITI